MPKVGEAFQDVSTGEITETTEVTGRIAFTYGGGMSACEVQRVTADLTYTPEQFLGLTIRLPVAARGLGGMMPLLLQAGAEEEEVLNLPPGQEMELILEARPEVLARLNAELLRSDSLVQVLTAGDEALLDLDNYHNGHCATAIRLEGE